LSESDAQDFIDVKHSDAFRVTLITHFVPARDL
jgi:hypothetical protein